MLYAQMYMCLAILCRVYKKPNLSEAVSLVAVTSSVVPTRQLWAVAHVTDVDGNSILAILLLLVLENLPPVVGQL